MLQDLRFTFRMILKEPWYTSIVVLVLALGIGVNATGFTIVNAAFLRGPAFEDLDQLYMLSWQPKGRQRSAVSYSELQDLRIQSRSFEAIGAFQETTVNISDDRVIPEQVEGAAVTANAFGILRQQPFLGRDFVSGEDAKSAQPVVILGYRLWQNRYGGDPEVIGAQLRINGQPAAIIGVMPDKMNFPINAELWLPFIPTAAQERRDVRILTAFGRLRNDSNLRGAQIELNGIAQRLAAEFPEMYGQLGGGRIETFTQRFIGGAARVVFPLIMAAGGFVLLIACANVANLLLSRSANRAREIAVRTALGASRRRILRQLLLESVVLGCLGGGAGLLLALVGTRALDAAITDPGKPYWIVFTMDYTVLGYVAAICILTGILFGLAPALHVSNTNINAGLKPRANWFSSAMVVVELALTIVLLVGAGLLVRSLFNLSTLDIGIKTENLMVMSLQLPDSRYATPESRNAFFHELEPRLSGVQGVQAVAVSTHAPPFGSEFRPVDIEGVERTTEEAPRVAAVTVTPPFFDVLNLRVLRGRNFTATDGAPGSENVIINERLATMFLGGQDPLGRRLRFNDEPWRTIVGISPSISHRPQEAERLPAVYIPSRQEPPARASLIIRSSLPPATVMDAVRREVQRIDRDQPVFTIATLDQMIEQSQWGHRTFGSVFIISAIVGLLMSSVGLYSVMAYAVLQRTREIGVRMALGADSRDISRLVLKRGVLQLAIGLALGTIGALAVSHMLGGMLVEVTPADPGTFAAVSLLVIVVAVAACLAPVRRAIKVDPLIAIRSE